MRAWKGLGVTVSTTVSNVLGIATARINTQSSTGLVVYKSKYQNPQVNHFTRWSILSQKSSSVKRPSYQETEYLRMQALESEKKVICQKYLSDRNGS